MKRILLMVVKENGRTEYFRSIAENRYAVECARNVDEAASILEDHMQDISAVIMDHPGGWPEFDRFHRQLETMNNYMMAVPLLLLTDEDCRREDERFLSDTAVGVIVEGESDRVVLHRIEQSVKVINSVSFQEFSEMLRALPSLIYLKDNKGRYVFCSQYWHHLDHYDDPDWTIRGKTDMDIRKNQANARLAYESDLRIVASGKGTSYVIEENDDGMHEYLQLIKEPLRNPDGSVRGIIAIINNVTEQEELRQELKRKSITDELTGLYNRMYYEEYVAGLGEDAYPISFISADCDGLKEINDLYGHVVGDEYIRMAAAMLRHVLPEEAPIFRTGGDEFLAILPRTDQEKVNQFMEKLTEQEKIFAVRQRTLSVSFGASTMHVPTGSFNLFIELSDSEMYRNKREKKEREKAKVRE